MDLKRLKHVVALADTRNFGRAAVQCHLTQSAFSRSIQAAEEEMGLLLFDRGTVEARCTEAGAFVVERARKLLFENSCLERDVSLYR
jgi:DNA-binding transcriptional LysR family regulator